jgi:hypothetical protein
MLRKLLLRKGLAFEYLLNLNLKNIRCFGGCFLIQSQDCDADLKFTQNSSRNGKDAVRAVAF